jgi:hypothetical protein
MPKPGDKFNGMSRTTLFEIIQDPQSGVRTAVIRKPGRTRGLRLIFVPSLMAYLDRLSGVKATPVSAREEVSIS